MKKIILFTGLALLIIGTSCKKDGCTDANATNYSTDADINDGTCTYQGKTSFWFGQSTSNNLINSYSVSNLTVYIDDVSVGTIDPSDWKVGPDCDGGNFTIINDLGGLDVKNITYSVNDQTGFSQFNGTIVVEANSCNNIQLN